jgi:transcriptional regulator with XRE-family HTH domain
LFGFPYILFCDSEQSKRRYQLGDIMPSVEIATKISEALEVSLDFLVGKSSLLVKDVDMLERLEDISKLPTAKQTELFNVMYAYLRDYRISKAYKK